MNVGQILDQPDSPSAWSLFLFSTIALPPFRVLLWFLYSFMSSLNSCTTVWRPVRESYAEIMVHCRLSTTLLSEALVCIRDDRVNCSQLIIWANSTLNVILYRVCALCLPKIFLLGDWSMSTSQLLSSSMLLLINTESDTVAPLVTF